MGSKIKRLRFTNIIQIVTFGFKATFTNDSPVKETQNLKWSMDAPFADDNA